MMTESRERGDRPRGGKKREEFWVERDSLDPTDRRLFLPFSFLTEREREWSEGRRLTLPFSTEGKGERGEEITPIPPDMKANENIWMVMYVLCVCDSPIYLSPEGIPVTI
jgi:hypothetical protein